MKTVWIWVSRKMETRSDRSLLNKVLYLVLSLDFKPLNTSPHPLKSHSSPCRPHLVMVPELLLLFALGRGVVGLDREGRKGQDIEAVEVDVEVWERGRGAEESMCGADGEEGRDEALACLHEGWKREKKLGESGIEGEDTAVEAGEVEADVKLGREIERVIFVASNVPWMQ